MTHCNLKAVRRSIDAIGGKCSGVILSRLFARPYRFVELLNVIRGLHIKDACRAF